MRTVLHIAQRELRGSLETPIGWVILTIFVLLTGLFFGLSLSLYHSAQLQATFDPYGGGGLDLSQHLLTPFFYNTAVMLVFLCPAVSMRSFAEDRRSRSLELLMTSPVSTLQIVLGKYLGALGFVALMLACTLHYPMILVGLGGQPDPGVLFGGYLAMLMLAGSYLAIGILASSWTENQVVALVMGFGIALMFWLLSWAGEGSETLSMQVLSYASILSHMESLLEGLLHTKDLLYYLSFITFFLFATHQRVENHRWS